HGTPINWHPLLPHTTATDLPTYPFQHHRYWLDSTASAAASGPGRATGHPLLGAAVPVAGGDELLFTGRVSLRAHPWLDDHRVQGTCVMPSAALVELAVRAGDEVGVSVLDELTVTAPLALPDSGAVQLQVRVGAADSAGRRAVTVHSRSDDGDGPWTEHAGGTLSATAVGVPFDLAAWPPAGAEAVPLDEAEALLDGAKVSYGSALGAPRAAWRRDGELFAELQLPQEQAEEAGFLLHPVLLDAAVRPVLYASQADGAAYSADEWRGVRLYATGASVVRVRISEADGGAARVQLADASGGPVAEIRSVAARAVPTGAVSASAHRHHDALFQVGWAPLLLPDTLDTVDATEVPWAVLGGEQGGAERFATPEEVGAAVAAGRALRFVVHRAQTGTEGSSPAAATHDATRRALDLTRAWLADDRLEKTPLLILTT
ncbi:polyketide synthase dehydratase domain-containing protein, partial [Streptomyces bluensis]